jgi:ribosomal protein S18 acetylase RimI-like enzyme
MSELVCLHAKEDVERFARRNLFVHIYALGDLDDFFWPFTSWFALRERGEIRQLVLLYLGVSIPTILAYADAPADSMRELMQALLPVLPRRFYAHLAVGVADVLAADYRIESHGTYYKMGMTDCARLAVVDASEATRLSVTDTAELKALYAASYPRNWFVPRMLETGHYYGVRRDGALVSVSGVHVFSPAYKVAALGNISTHPDFRGQGLATIATARLCQELLCAGIEHIGLNVNAENSSAVACYRKLGFERIADYGEYTLELK